MTDAKAKRGRNSSASESTISNCSPNSPSHKYNTRYSVKFFSEAIQHPEGQSYELKKYKKSSSSKYAEMDGEDDDMNNECLDLFSTIPILDRANALHLPNSGGSYHKFFAFFAFASLTVAFGTLALMFAYISDKSVSSVRSDISTLAEEVRQVQGKLYSMTDALAVISMGLTGVQENLLSENNLKTAMQTEILRYDSDKTGMTDFALESAGGQILSTRDTVPYQDPGFSLLGLSFCAAKNSARSLIQASTLPGECWAFRGQKGSVVIKLLGNVHITGVSIEHISRSISPSGDNSSAPKTFSVYGLTSKDDTSGSFLLGSFSYDIEGPTLQYFVVKKTCPRAFEIVELAIETNHGNKEYTCVYRLRVHGHLDGKEIL